MLYSLENLAVILNLIRTFPEKGRKGNALQLIHRAILNQRQMRHGQYKRE